MWAGRRTGRWRWPGRLQQLEEENGKLNQLTVDLTLDKVILQEVPQKIPAASHASVLGVKLVAQLSLRQANFTSGDKDI